MAAHLTRILSDLHYGDRSSRVVALPSLAPLFAGVDHLIFNGDTLDTRPGPDPDFTQTLRDTVTDYLPRQAPTVTFLTGNHDPDLSSVTALDLAGGQILVTHGDILFDNIVPWGMDAVVAGQLVANEIAALPPATRDRLEDRLGAYRRAALAIPQRHQSERNPWKYRVRFARDTVWPPLRIFRILNAWRTAPRHAREVAARYRPDAKFIILGHTHRPGVWPRPNGVTVINTGSYAPPLGGFCVDLTPSHLTVRRVVERAGEFHPGPQVAQFALADV